MSPSHRTLASRHSIDSCAVQLHSWRPFHPKTLDSDHPQIPNSSSNGGGGGFHSKRPCLSDRLTSFSIDAALDMSRLSLFDDDRPMVDVGNSKRRESLQLIARKRRRRGSRSVSGRSSDRSGTRRCCSVGASAAASDFPMAVGTDSSGELFGNGDWASDVSEARNNSGPRRDKDGGGGGSGERENVGLGFGQTGNFGDVVPGNESGYGSEPGYRGDAEFGYGDEVDEEEEDARALFWGHQFGERVRNGLECWKDYYHIPKWRWLVRTRSQIRRLITDAGGRSTTLEWSNLPDIADLSFEWISLSITLLVFVSSLALGWSRVLV